MDGGDDIQLSTRLFNSIETNTREAKQFIPHSAMDPPKDPLAEHYGHLIQPFQVSPDQVMVYRNDRLGGGNNRTTIFRGRWEGRDIAVKESKWLDTVRQHREILMGRILSHPNICSIYGWCSDGDYLYILMPLRKQGSLHDLLSSAAHQRVSPANGGPLGWTKFFTVCIELLRALRYMSSRTPPAIHRDLKPTNILLDDDGYAQLCDFSLTTNAVNPDTTAGTLPYMSPEQLEGEPQTPAADIYSFACVAWEMLHTPRIPRDSCNGIKAHAEATLNGVPLDFSGVPSCLHFFEGCFTRAPSARPTAETLMQKMVEAAATLGVDLRL